MKHVTKTLAMLFLVGMVALTACKKDAQTSDEEISSATLAKISDLGFSTVNVQKISEGYLVEGDIILTEQQLDERITSPQLRIAEEEQYHTFNLVSGLPRNITVSVAASLPTSVSNAVNDAIARYNAEGLQITFQRVNSSGNIHFSAAPSGANYIASAGFPTSGGNPYSSVVFNTAYAGWQAATLASICAHEMGHCIGFRHTDYMRRRFSCGYGGNEGQAKNGVGAVWIPGTPTGPDDESWMLACIGNGDDRPFNVNDVIALDYLY
jgi:Dual-action HEIGH metallo-peptidase